MERVELGPGLPAHPQSHGHVATDGSGRVQITDVLPGGGVLGTTWYSSGTAVSALAGNISTTAKYLRSLGGGLSAAAPAWQQVDFADLLHALDTAHTWTALQTFSGTTQEVLIQLGSGQVQRAFEIDDVNGVEAISMLGGGAVDLRISEYANPVIIRGRRANNTSASNTALAADDEIIRIGGTGYSTSMLAVDRGRFSVFAAEAWGASANGTYVVIQTTKKAGTTTAEAFRVTDDKAYWQPEVASIANPASGSLGAFAGTDHKPYAQDSSGNIRGLNFGLARLSADAAIANTETVVMSSVLPADFLVAGTTFFIRAYGTITTGATGGTSTFRIRIGTTTLIGNIATSVAPANANSVTAAPTAFTSKDTISATTATVAVDTTASKRLELTYISGNAGSTATFRNGFIQMVAAA